jgi:hypothetical protein
VLLLFGNKVRDPGRNLSRETRLPDDTRQQHAVDQITGKPASASALNSHCDSGQAPIIIQGLWEAIGKLKEEDII